MLFLDESDQQPESGDVVVYLAWWFHVYASLLAFVCAITRAEPDEEKVGYWALRAIRMRAVK